jgi:hypothetical protein
MSGKMTEEKAKQHVKRLAVFYKEMTIYVAANLLFILIWLLSGAGYFWPIWVILGWGIPLFLQALYLNLLPSTVQENFRSAMDFFPYFKPEWEAQEVAKYMKKSGSVASNPGPARSSAAAKPAVKKAAVKKSPAKKTSTKKKASTAKKRTSTAKKKASPKKAASSKK